MSLFRNRKRTNLSLDSAPLGLERPRFRRTHLGYPYAAPTTAPTNYPAPPAPAYDPRPASVDSTEPEYEEYHWHHTRQSSRLHRDPASPMKRVFEPATPDYDSLPMTDALLAQALEEANAGSISVEAFPTGGEPTGSNKFMDPAPQAIDRQDCLFEAIEAALVAQMAPQAAHSPLEHLASDQPDLYLAREARSGILPEDAHPDPVEQARQIFDQQMQALDQMFEPQPEPFEMRQQLMSDLESMTEQETDPMMEIGAAVDQQVQAGAGQSPGAQPHVPCDDYLQVYDEQVQQMMDSYWMPGPPLGPMG